MRYMLFANYDYYPEGGRLDHIASYDSIEECRSKFYEEELAWYDIYDTETHEWVEQGRNEEADY